MTKVELTEHSPTIMSSDEEVSPPTKAARVEANVGIGGLPTPIASPAGDPPPLDVTEFQTLFTKLAQHFAKLEQNFSPSIRAALHHVSRAADPSAGAVRC